MSQLTKQEILDIDRQGGELANLIAEIQVQLERTGFAKSERLATFIRRASLKHEVKARKWQELPEVALTNLLKELKKMESKL